MRNVEVIKVFNLENSKGNKLQLRLGVLKDRSGDVCISNADRGFRWSFVGKSIPMPVRSLTWFNGFSEGVMLDWLKGNGWAVRSTVNMISGSTTVYELPEASKGNENSDALAEYNKEAFYDALRLLYYTKGILHAVRLYRYVFPKCSLREAKDAVVAICAIS